MNAQPIVSHESQVEEFSKYLSSCHPLTWEESYISPYYDMLQLPLQPLADNMENSIYETFEYDRTKYDLYEDAVYGAISSLLKDYPEESDIRLAVVGAGRGGLINACVRAINRLSNESIRFHITGVEKNPNAARTLKYKAHDDELWHSNNRIQINIVESDMRSWKPEQTIDILVSELLGSLSDNEASPECIDGVMHVLDPLRGVSIPSRYFSSLQPVSCERAWVSARGSNKLEHILVSALHNCYTVREPKTLFEFVHEPGPGGLSDSNERETTLSWSVGELDLTIHGFIGYFHADLIGSVTLSTHPPTKSEHMVSWFPAFLPLKKPIFVRAGETITASIHRRLERNKRMWFEWQLIHPFTQEVNNQDGKVYSIGL
jgi:protein arginine N-methyltransferase 5